MLEASKTSLSTLKIQASKDTNDILKSFGSFNIIVSKEKNV